MGIKRADLAAGRPVCGECLGVGTGLNNGQVRPCPKCKGLGVIRQ